MASEVSICSNALVRLGDNPINSFSDNTKTARLCSNLWPTVRDDVLRGHPWNCATARVVLAPDLIAPAFGYSARFLLPGDYLRVLGNGDYDNDEFEYEIEGRYILCDASVLKLRYLFRNEVVASWDAMLVSVMERAMQAAMSYAVTKSTSKETADQNAFLFAIKQARAVDGQEGTPATLGDFPFMSARY